MSNMIPTNSREVYLKLYRTADAIIKAENPCKFETKDGVTTCIANRAGTGQNGCCAGCPHLDQEKGCTIQALGCKLYACHRVDRNISDALWDIMQVARSANIPTPCWAGVSEHFNEDGSVKHA